MHLFVQQKIETALPNATILMLSLTEQFLAPTFWPRTKQARKGNFVISFILDTEIDIYTAEFRVKF